MFPVSNLRVYVYVLTLSRHSVCDNCFAVCDMINLAIQWSLTCVATHVHQKCGLSRGVGLLSGWLLKRGSTVHHLCHCYNQFNVLDMNFMIEINMRLII